MCHWTKHACQRDRACNIPDAGATLAASTDANARMSLTREQQTADQGVLLHGLSSKKVEKRQFSNKTKVSVSFPLGKALEDQNC